MPGDLIPETGLHHKRQAGQIRPYESFRPRTSGRRQHQNTCCHDNTRSDCHSGSNWGQPKEAMRALAASPILLQRSESEASDVIAAAGEVGSSLGTPKALTPGSTTARGPGEASVRIIGKTSSHDLRKGIGHAFKTVTQHEHSSFNQEALRIRAKHQAWQLIRHAKILRLQSVALQSNTHQDDGQRRCCAAQPGHALNQHIQPLLRHQAGTKD